MAWLSLIVAGLFEVVWAVGLKYTDGFSRFVPSCITLIAMGLSFFLLSYALKTLPIGTAYAIWTGIGALGTVIIGILVFNESAEPIRLCFIALLLLAMAGLKYTS